MDQKKSLKVLVQMHYVRTQRKSTIKYSLNMRGQSVQQTLCALLAANAGVMR
jgi:hypothetical protein